jgi:hypothetical protein
LDESSNLSGSTMNARTIGLKLVGLLAAVATLSTLSGCMVVTRPLPRGGVVTRVTPAPVVVAPSRTVVVFR